MVNIVIVISATIVEEDVMINPPHIKRCIETVASIVAVVAVVAVAWPCRPKYLLYTRKGQYQQ
jgi:hypothetical protein